VDYYGRAPQASPKGPASGKRRVSRGGAWRHKDKFTRVTARSSIPPEFRYSDYGFRIYADAD
jgi:formylglycine-generating enzyme required for sulfatase activity